MEQPLFYTIFPDISLKLFSTSSVKIKKIQTKLSAYTIPAFSKCFFNIRIESTASAKLVITVNAIIEL